MLTGAGNFMCVDVSAKVQFGSALHASANDYCVCKACVLSANALPSIRIPFHIAAIAFWKFTGHKKL
jgi:hypothetical protein